MIEQAEFINFQSHTYSLLEFSHKLSIIKGRSHSGKSSLIRGLKWLIENKPRAVGDKYKSDHADKSDPISVSISFSEGTFITREKTVKQNAYITSEHKDPFVALKADVPNEIVEITKLRPQNLRSQNDRYFLIDKTSGQVATELNKVVGLQIIDEKSVKIKKIVSGLSNRLKVVESLISETKEKLKARRFQVADKLKSSIDKLDEKIDLYFSEKQSLLDLKELFTKINDNAKIIKSSKLIVGFEKDISKLRDVIGEYERKSDNLDRIQDAVANIKKHDSEIKESNNILKFKDKLSPINEEIKIYYSISGALAEVKRLYRNIAENKKTAVTSLQTIEQGNLNLSELKKELTKKMEYCDECGAHRDHWTKNLN